MYNPFQGAQIHLYPTDRDVRNPRRYILETYGTGDSAIAAASAARGRIDVQIDMNRNVKVTVNGKETERYSIIYAGRAQRKLYSQS